MKLDKIIITGFKSFYNKNILKIDSNLTAIVGPNGCGKSNIIDAIRWVLGESSARNLRGENFTDIIFNGSLTKKPGNLASVELIFENIDNLIVLGQKEFFHEISIKRQIDRSGVNQYFLNSIKCRKKDIVDLFLGTGLGPKGYSVIEQGMISKIVESTPQELRYFMEEAAGVAKYKDRKKETESKLIRTGDNLKRLNDLLNELSIQLEVLEIQAKDALHYQNLKNQYKVISSQIFALNINDFVIKLEKTGSLIEKNKIYLTKLTKDEQIIQSDLNNFNIILKDKESKVNDLKFFLNDYSNKISNFQDFININQNRINQIESDKNKFLEKLDLLKNDLSLLKNKTHLKHEEIDLLDLSIIEQDYTSCILEVSKLEDALIELNLRKGNYVEDIYQLQNDINLLNTSLNNLRLQNEKLTEIHDIKFTNEENEISQLLLKENILDEKILDLKLVIESLKEDFDNKKSNISYFDQSLNDLNFQIQNLNNEYLQNQTVLKTINVLDVKNEKNNNLKLIDVVNIKSGFELVFDSLLSDKLNYSICDNFQDSLENAKKGINSFILKKSSNKNFLDGSISSSYNIDFLFDNIEITDKNIDDIRFFNKTIINKEGFIIGSNFIKSLSKNNSELSNRKKVVDSLNNLKQIEIKLDILENKKEEFLHQKTNLLEELDNLKKNLEDRRFILDANMKEHLVIKSDLKNKEIFLEEKKYNHSLLINKQQDNIEEIKEEIFFKNKLLLENQNKINLLKQSLISIDKDIFDMNNALIKAKKNIDFLSTQKNEFLLKKQEIFHNEILIQEKEKNIENQILTINQSIQSLEEEFFEKSLMNENKNKDLIVLQDNYYNSQKELESLKEDLNINILKIKDFKSKLLEIKNKIMMTKDDIYKHDQLKNQYQIKLENMIEKAQEQNFDLNFLSTVDVTDSQENLNRNLKLIQDEINYLGPLNLTSVDQFDKVKKRFDFLQEQKKDLEESIDKLNAVIKKLEKEMSLQFENTLILINKELNIIFHQIFNGGGAKLVINDLNDKNSGISLMAHPPGKRNNLINLLSGGEKALTALALVFAIFKLNPAPFCLLDEVDAPLDDVNVTRYIELVKSMSQKLQFIYITHNKIAMEKAVDIVGVTMVEPGLSKLIKINLDKALEVKVN